MSAEVRVESDPPGTCWFSRMAIEPCSDNPRDRVEVVHAFPPSGPCPTFVPLEAA